MPLEDPILNPNLGLYLDRGSLSIPPRGLSDCLNIRIQNGRIERDNLGWSPFPDSGNAVQLDNPVTGIDNIKFRDGGQRLVFLTTTDVYLYDEGDSSVRFLTPRYETGTVDITNGSATVTGTGTGWSSELDSGDFIHVGATGQTDPDATWYEIDAVDSDTQITLTSAYQEATSSGASYTARQVFTGTVQNPWVTETFHAATDVQGTDGDRWYAVNGVDPIIGWDGNTDQVYFPDMGNVDTCRTMVRFKNMLLLVNITADGDNRPVTVRNSAIGQPENTVTNEAGETVIHDGADPLVAVGPLGDNIVFYSENKIVTAQFVGGDVQFAFRIAASDVGALGVRAVADFGDYHEIIDRDGQFQFDGVNLRESGTQVWREVLRKQSPNRLSLLQHHFDDENAELHWVVPLTTDPGDSPRTSFTEHYLELTGEDEPVPITKRDLPATAFGKFERQTTLTFDQLAEQWQEINLRWDDSALHAAFPFNLFGDIDGNVFVLGTQDSQDGGDIVSFARFGRRPLGNTRTKGTILRVYPFCDRLPAETDGMDVYLNLTDDPAGDTQRAGPFNYDLTHAGNHFVSPRRTGRYVELEFRREGVGKPYMIEGYDMEVVKAGQR